MERAMLKRRYVLGLCVIMMLGGAAVRSQEKGEIIKVEKKGENEVVITYELNGDRNADYEVEFYLTSDKDPSFKIRLKSLKGDVEGKLAGSPRKITWDHVSDYPAVKPGEEYRVKMKWDRVSGGWPWYVYAGASAVVGGAAYLLTRPGEEQQQQTDVQPIPTVPLPPSRPPN
jgi:hypothetical protein